MPKLLKFVEKSDNILRQVMPEVTDVNSKEIKEIIQNMSFSITPPQLKKAKGAHDSAAGMAANQWGIRQRIFIFTPDGSQPGAKKEVMINPTYEPIGEETSLAYEGCFSVPLTTGVVKRFEKIKATYQTPDGEQIEKEMQGWEARVFQHETDHLDGKLFDGRLDGYNGPECLDRIVFENKNEMKKFWDRDVKPSREQ